MATSMILRGGAVLVAVSLAGCGNDDCGRAYATEKKCSKVGDKLPDKDTFVLGCNAALKDDRLHDQIAGEIECAQQDSCEAYLKCGRARRGKARAQEITKAVEAGAWKDAWDDCTLIADYFAADDYRAVCIKVFKEARFEGDDAQHAMYRCRADDVRKVVPELDQRCKAMQDAHLSSTRTAALATRDAGKNDFKLCMDLQQAAVGAGSDAAASARSLCDEMMQAEPAKKAIEEAHANIAAKKTDVPFACELAAMQLAKLDTEWAKQQREAVLEACYVDLGMVLLAVEPKEARYYCPLRVRRVQQAIENHKLAAKYPALAAAIAKLPRKCK